MLVLASTTVFAQSVCGFSQTAAPGVGRDYVTVSGIMCMSREAAIAAARHWRDQGISLNDALVYVNRVRGEKTCFYADDAVAKKISQQVNTDQFDRRLAVSVWEVVVEDHTLTAVSAGYLDGC